MPQCPPPVTGAPTPTFPAPSAFPRSIGAEVTPTSTALSMLANTTGTVLPKKATRGSDTSSGVAIEPEGYRMNTQYA